LFSEDLAASMREETLRLVEDIVFERDASVLELFDADYTFVDEALAELYDLTPPSPGEWIAVEQPGRAGVLTHAGWLATQAHNNINSPTRRGLFVMEQLLCGEIPPPPPRVNPEPILPTEGQTLRDALSQHMEDLSCASCHALTDPIGFAFEHYDAIGAYRTLDNGQSIDASGEVAGLGAFDGASELAQLLRNDPRSSRCLVEKVYTGGLGWVPDEGAAPAFDAVDEAFVAADANMKQLLVELTVSPVFRQVDEPK
jgi:hypothetical protein